MLIIYIAVTLLFQHSFAQNLDNEFIAQDEKIKTVDSEENISYLQYSSVEDDKTIETSSHPLTIQNDMVDGNEGDVTIDNGVDEANGKDIAEDKCGESCNSGSSEMQVINEIIGPEVKPCVDEVITNNGLTIPVECEENIIIAQVGFEDDNKPACDVLDESIPIPFCGPVKAQGKVAITAHFGCGDNDYYTVSSDANDSEEAANDISDGCTSFDGPVQAKGRISIGTHYGCGAPLGFPTPMPWFLSTPYPRTYPSYPIPNIFLAQYPFPMPDTMPFVSPNIPESADILNIAGNQELPVASVLADLNSGNEDTLQNLAFTGTVPVCGTIKISARF